MLKSFGDAHVQPDGAAQHPRWECTLAAVSSQTHPKNVPVRPPWPELHCSRPPPAAAAESRGLEGQARVTGLLPGPPGQPAVTIFRIEGLVCCTAESTSVVQIMYATMMAILEMQGVSRGTKCVAAAVMRL